MAATALVACATADRDSARDSKEPSVPPNPRASELNAELLALTVLRPGDYDETAVTTIFNQQSLHKQVFLTENLFPPAAFAQIYMKMQSSLNSFEFSMRGSPLAVIGVLMGNATLLALNDRMWSEYSIGAAYGFNAAKGSPATSNIFHKARTRLQLDGNPWQLRSIYHDLSGAAVLKRGAQFFVCNVALATVAYKLASSHHQDAATVLKVLRKNFFQGYHLVPSGVSAAQVAQESGWRPYLT